MLLYWEIGQQILESQQREGWGAKIVDRLATDLRQSFPESTGFSPRNLLFMRAFAEEFSDSQIVKQLVSQIPWGHIVRVMQKLKDPAEREFYIRQTIAHGWSRAVLVHQIESGLHQRQGQALNNFDRVLPAPQSTLQGQQKPIGVASYRTMPAHLRGTLPSPREIEAGLVTLDAVN